MTNIERLRNKIDLLDAEISVALTKRLELAKEIGVEKAKSGLPITNSKREEEVLCNICKNAQNEEQIPLLRAIYGEIFAAAKKYEEGATSKCQDSEKYGLLGRTLGHSISPQIHRLLCDNSYELFEVEPENVENFLKNGDFSAINVTVPYKQKAIEFLDELSDVAKNVGAVNTIVRKNGRLLGFNTDVFGFEMLLKASGVEVPGKDCLILGSGGASAAVSYVLKKQGAKTVKIVSRKGPLNYENVKEENPEIIINATPVGMSPDVDGKIIDIECFDRLYAVIDLIYNPFKTRLLLDAKQMDGKIKVVNGLFMLVAQAVLSNFIFKSGEEPTDEKELHNLLKKAYEIYAKIITKEYNIVLIGMPGSGKTTVGRELAADLGKKFVDTDEMIFEKYNKTAAEIIKSEGVEAFRKLETEVAKEVGTMKNVVIATGGGIVTVPENYPLLAQNGIVVFLNTPLEMLDKKGRPLSETKGVKKLYAERCDLYKKWADAKFII